MSWVAAWVWGASPHHKENLPLPSVLLLPGLNPPPVPSAQAAGSPWTQLFLSKGVGKVGFLPFCFLKLEWKHREAINAFQE